MPLPGPVGWADFSVPALPSSLAFVSERGCFKKGVHCCGQNNGLAAHSGDSYSTPGRGGVGSCESDSKYVLDVLKPREKLKISLSWSCPPGPRAAKFQSPGDLFVSPAASFVQAAQTEIQALLWACAGSRSVPGSTSAPPAGISENPTPNVN